ncbi:MAG: VWA domain-containing protein [Treponema sp.]|jgi:Ca-activated chloride channel family protein|nr:VWA domain-containing protein [Treponema sp.]
MTMIFERPYFIVIGIAVIPFILVSSRYLRSVFTLEFPLGPPGGISFKPPVNIDFLMKFIRFLELTGMVLLFAAAAGPVFIRTETVWLNRGADIVFVMDISPSMAGMDMNGRSRFDEARDLVRDFAIRRPQDALGLVALGEDAAVLMPLTTDRDSFFSRLDSLVIGELGDGTAIGMGLAAAGFHLSGSSAPRRAAVLITDGENNAGTVHPETAAAVLGDIGVSLWVIGVGSGGNVPINYVDPFTHVRRTGTFHSYFDPQSLIAIAEKARGIWIAAPSAEAFASAFARLDQGETVLRRSALVRHKEPFHELFIIAAILVFCFVRFVRLYILRALI